MKIIRVLLYFVVFLVALRANAQHQIIAKALYKNGAVVELDGKQIILKAGKASPSGIALISANSKQAVVEYQGQRYTLLLSKQIHTQYAKANKAETRIPSGTNGHYFISGTINGSATQFMVDTGASSVAMSSAHAAALGVNLTGGEFISVSTASGVEQAYALLLDKVSVGSITLHNVEAVVIQGDYPQKILLGNSFLSRVNMRVDSGVLVLQAKY